MSWGWNWHLTIILILIYQYKTWQIMKPTFETMFVTLQTFFSRLLVKIVERGKRKLKKVLSVTKHGFVFWQHLSYERIQALKTGQEPGLLAPVDLASLSQVKVPINQKASTFPKKSLETIQRSVPFNQRGSTSDNMKTECSCLEKSPQTMCLGSCLCSPCRIKHPNEAKKCYCPSLCR